MQIKEIKALRKQEVHWITRKPLNFKNTIQRFNLTILIPQLERFGYIVKGESEKWVYWLEGKKERIPFFCSKEEAERWGLKTAKIIEVARVTLNDNLYNFARNNAKMRREMELENARAV